MAFHTFVLLLIFVVLMLVLMLHLCRCLYLCSCYICIDACICDDVCICDDITFVLLPSIHNPQDGEASRDRDGALSRLPNAQVPKIQDSAVTKRILGPNFS